MRSPRRHEEAEIQKGIVRDLSQVLLPPFILHHSANEGGKGSKAAQGILKAMGVYAGFSDLLLLGPERRGLFLEVKTKAGRQHPTQISFEQQVGEFGWPYEVVRSSVEAIDAVVRHGFPTRIKTWGGRGQ
ncbi:MAG: VRR-NUC domain-containing protein [bacterium]|nr:VRR-NUC domain-containing protein [bacterium]